MVTSETKEIERYGIEQVEYNIEEIFVDGSCWSESIIVSSSCYSRTPYIRVFDSGDASNV